MAEFKERIDALAFLMEEYRLTEAILEDGPYRVVFRRRARSVAVSPLVEGAVEEIDETFSAPELVVATEPAGSPVTTPMSGIFYDAPSPTSPPFVREGDLVTAGQIVGLIEAMKVFNEIPSPIGGTVGKIVAESGSIVAVGDPLILLT